jgi:large subunit ribosomal protein L25
VPIVSSGKAVGEELGGRIRTLVRTVNVRCDYTKIPEAVQVDVTSLAVGDFAKISSATPVKGVEVVFDQDFNVLTCYGASAPKEEEEVAPVVAVVAEEVES